MHQRNDKKSPLQPSPLTEIASPEEGKDTSSGEGWLGEDRSLSPSGDGDPEDHAFLSDVMDLEATAVDLPCDDDGRVFLAPLRKLNELDDDAGVRQRDFDLLATSLAHDDDPTDHIDAAQGSFEFGLLDDNHEAMEPALDSVVEASVKRDAITDAFISLKVLPELDDQSGLDFQDVDLSDDEIVEDWIDEQLTLLPVESDTSSTFATENETPAGPISVPTGTTSSDGRRTLMPALRVVGQRAVAVASQVSGGLQAMSAIMAQVWQTLLRNIPKYSAFVRQSSAKTLGIMSSYGARLGRAAMQQLGFASILLIGLARRLGRKLGPASSVIMSALRAKFVGFLRLSMSWLSTKRRSLSSAMLRLASFLNVIGSMLATKIVHLSSYLKPSPADANTDAVQASRKNMSAASAIRYVALASTLTTMRATCRSIGMSINQTIKLIIKRKRLDRGIAAVVGGIPFNLRSARNMIMTTKFNDSKFQLTSLGGLSAAAAVAVLFLAAGSEGPVLTRSDIVLSVPPKPADTQKETLQDPIIFDWPAIEILSNQPDDAEAINTYQVAPFTAGESVLLSPDAALTQLIDNDALTGGSAIPAALTDGQPAAFDLDAAPSGLTTDPKARLAALTLLADIEAIEKAGEFAKALRTVGLETVIQPGEPYTILVPSDAAFAELGQNALEELLQPSGHERLRALLSRHFLKERVAFEDFAGKVGSYSSMAGQSITIDATDVIKVDNASLIETDIRATNTLIHVIDNILRPSGPATRGVAPYVTPFEVSSDT